MVVVTIIFAYHANLLNYSFLKKMEFVFYR